MSTIICKSALCPYNKGLYCDKLTLFINAEGQCEELYPRRKTYQGSLPHYTKQKKQEVITNEVKNDGFETKDDSEIKTENDD